VRAAAWQAVRGEMSVAVVHEGLRGRFLNPGDVIELEVERIGVLRNRIIKQR
jgi:2-keto-4-pentenoate hydratase/2-oxohepta-3-ene-1,7-dioic acid hydratase in catechol pathway